MYIIAAAPDQNSLGATNGVAQTVVSVVRAVTPVASTSLFAATIEKHLMGGMLIYWILILFTLVALRIASLLPRNAVT